MLRLRIRASNLVGLPGFERYDSRVSLSGALRDIHRCHDILSHVILLLYYIVTAFFVPSSYCQCQTLIAFCKNGSLYFWPPPFERSATRLPRSPSTCTLYGKLCKLYALPTVPPLTKSCTIDPWRCGTIVAMATVLYSIAVV